MLRKTFLLSIPFWILQHMTKCNWIKSVIERLGIKSVGDLINFYPRTYEDWSNIKHIDELEYGETVCIKAVVATSVNDTRISGGRIISKTAVYVNL